MLTVRHNCDAQYKPHNIKIWINILNLNILYEYIIYMISNIFLTREDAK